MAQKAQNSNLVLYSQYHCRIYRCRSSGPVAVVVGTEQLGLSETWLNAADLKVRIPMMGVADSLNVATATTLLLYEVLRQRRVHL
jgi:tRNA G18 (ribose-2'-O)-methylase SpoU